MVASTTIGTLADGTPIHLFTVTNDAGIELRTITWGGIITALLVPDRDGMREDVVLGYDDWRSYLDQKAYFGAIIGRYANRIAHARFSLDGRTYHLSANEGANHLHGGIRGFDKHLWRGVPVHTSAGDAVSLSRVSVDGEEGYPGTLRVSVRYLITRSNELQVDYEADTDAPTVINLTQHSYFNLASGSADILGHVLTLDSDAYTPVNAELLPIGNIEPVDATPFDFRQGRIIGATIHDANDQLRYGRGFDHNWVRRSDSSRLARVARVVEPASGRVLELLTTEPGLQFYSGNQLDGSIAGKGGSRYQRHAGFCLESQHFPDAPNQPVFPSPVLRPGQLFRSRTVFRFSIADG